MAKIRSKSQNSLFGRAPPSVITNMSHPADMPISLLLSSMTLHTHKHTLAVTIIHPTLEEMKEKGKMDHQRTFDSTISLLNQIGILNCCFQRQMDLIYITHFIKLNSHTLYYFIYMLLNFTSCKMSMYHALKTLTIQTMLILCIFITIMICNKQYFDL